MLQVPEKGFIGPKCGAWLRFTTCWSASLTRHSGPLLSPILNFWLELSTFTSYRFRRTNSRIARVEQLQLFQQNRYCVSESERLYEYSIKGIEDCRCVSGGDGGDLRAWIHPGQ